MHIGQDVLSNLDRALAAEWLLTNGLGGYASGTVAGALTRRTQGLLVAASPHGKLSTALLKLEERVQVAGESFELGGNLTAGALARPSGHRLIEEFRLEPWPTWRFRAGDSVIEKSLLLVYAHNAVAVCYRHLEGPATRLTLTPLIAARDPNALQHENPDIRGVAQGVPGRVRIETYGGRPALTIWHSAAFLPARAWQRRLEYPGDGESGATEDAFVPGYFEGALEPRGELHLVAATEDELFRTLAQEDRLGSPPPRTLAECVAALARGERERRAAWRRVTLLGADFTVRQAAASHGGAGEGVARRREPLVDASDPWVAPLARRLQDGLARRGRRLTMLTAFPGSGERGNDTLRTVLALISLRAFEAAGEVLRGYLEYLSEGLAPESFDVSDGRPRYGDAMPALWLVNACDLLTRRGDDLELLRETIYPALEGVMQHYRAGTHHGIGVDPDGLLRADENGRSLKRADRNALWYHALVAMAQLARLVGRKESGAFYLAWAHAHQRGFNDLLWDDERGCLYHARAGSEPVHGLTPSQLLAVCLRPAILPPERARRLVETVERELFDGSGLREAPRETVTSTAWLGPFAAALLRVQGRSAEAQERVRGWLEALAASSPLAAAGPLPEQAGPRGSDASILAAAELLRVWIEELDHVESAAVVG